MKIQDEIFLEHLVLQGAIEMSGFDENGEMLYTITDKLKLVSPELYKKLEGQFNDHILQLVDAGPKIMTWRFRG